MVATIVAGRVNRERGRPYLRKAEVPQNRLLKNLFWVYSFLLRFLVLLCLSLAMLLIAVGLGLLALGMATPTAPVVTPGRNGHAGTACPKLTLLGYTPVLRGPSEGSCSGRLLPGTPAAAAAAEVDR